MEKKIEKISRAFWNNKRVLITGHTGFKGSWMTRLLVMLGAKVCGMSLSPNTKPSLFDILDLSKEIEHNIADIKKFKNISKVVQSFNPEIIFHMAAQPLVSKSYKRPIQTIQTNVIGTVNLLEVARRNECSIKAIVNVTSDKVYYNVNTDREFKETDPLGGSDIYSSSKACSDLLTTSYAYSFLEEKKIFLASARSGNVIGGGDWADNRLLPDLVRTHLSNKNLCIRSPSSIRPWQHVLEPISGYIMLAQRLYTNGEKFAGSWNFGPQKDDCISVSSLLKRISQQSKWSVNWRLGKYKDFKEMYKLKLNSSKSKSKLGWEQTWGLDKALLQTLTWYDCWLDNKDMNTITNHQIDQYLSESIYISD